MSTPNVLVTRLAALALCLSATAVFASSLPYLDDSNIQPDAPVVSGSFPKVMMTETQSLTGTTEQFSKYDVIGAKAGMITKVNQILKLNKDMRFHYGFSPRAYQGFNMDDPCNLSNGMTFSKAGPSTKNCEIFAGHWLYYAGTRLTDSAAANATTIFVNDGSRLTVGQYVVIYDAPAGSFKNAEHALVTGINRSSYPHRVTLSKRGYKSTARARSANAIIAQHVLGRGKDHPENWGWNHATTAPLDADNRTIGEAMVKWLVDNLGRRGNGNMTNTPIHGIYFDADPYFNEIEAERLDGDNDLVPDRLISATGVNLWGEGLEQFYALVRARFPDLTIVGGARRSRGFDSLNGIQVEGWAVAGDYAAKVPNYGHSGGNDGFDSMLQRYLIHLQYHPTATGHTENLSKIPTKLYPNGQTGVASNAPFRLGLASTLLGDGYYGQQNSAQNPDPWYDEYAVNVTPGSSTYGHAIRSTPSNEAQIRNNKGWLGRPLGPHKRLYSATQFAANKALFGNNGFENGSNGWTFSNVDASVVTSGALAGSRALRINRHNQFSPDVNGAKVSAPAVALTAGKQYTLAFAARASQMREVTVRVEGARNIYLIPQRWTRIVHTFTATKTGNFRADFLVGMEDIPMWLDEVYLFEGNANVFMREFENGIVVANATPSQRTVDLGDTYMRIKGTGQDPVNNGAQVSSLTLPAYDAAVLVRLDGAQIDPPPPGPGDGDPPPPPPPPPGDGVCGEPAMTHTANRIFYIWADTCTSGLWHARVKSNSGVQTFSGQIESNGAFSAVQGYKLESTDVLTSTASRIDFGLTVGQNAEDGLQFRVSGSGEVCLTPEQPGITQVRLGANAAVVSTPVNILTGGNCGATDRISLGEPDYRDRSERATFLWEDPNTGDWHVRMINGGVSGEGRFDGSLTGTGILGLSAFKLESDDVLNQSGSSGSVNYSFSVYTTAEDGFGFRLASGASPCFNPGSQHPLYVGANRVRVSGGINLATLGSCN